MLIQRLNPETGQNEEREIDITDDQLHRWSRGEDINEVMPNISQTDRDFILRGAFDEKKGSPQ